MIAAGLAAAARVPRAPTRLLQPPEACTRSVRLAWPPIFAAYCGRSICRTEPSTGSQYAQEAAISQGSLRLLCGACCR
jgi:hypothetical protein